MPGDTYPMLTVVFCAIGVTCLLFPWRDLRGWTVTDAWGWSIVAVATVGAIELAVLVSGIAGSRTDWARDARYVAAVASFCPAMSLMGAKRPHHGAWHFVVASLWAVLSLPALKSLVLGGRLELHDIGGWFVWVLLLCSGVNMLPTRFWGAAVTATAGQVLLLSAHLPLIRRDLGAAGPCLATACWATAAGLAWWRLRGTTRPGRSLDESWIVFRDLYGALWGLRVIERFNDSARRNRWPVSLGWWGLQERDTADGTGPSRQVRRAARQTLTNLWRRFAPADWLEAMAEED